MAVHMLSNSVNDHDDNRGQRAMFTEACEIDPRCREVLHAWPQSPPTIIHPDVMAKLTRPARASVEEISSRIHTTFMAACQAGENKSVARDRLSRQCFKEMSAILSLKGAYLRLRAPDADALSLHVAGSPCVHWSTQGDRSGLCGRSNQCFLTWLFERAHCQEDLVLHENTEAFEEKWLFKVLGSTHFIMVLCISPSDLGFPARRLRKWTCMARKTRFAGWADSFAIDVAGYGRLQKE